MGSWKEIRGELAGNTLTVPSVCSTHLSFYSKRSKGPEATWRVWDVTVAMDDLDRTYSLSAEGSAGMEPFLQLVQKMACRLQVIATC